MTKPTETPAKPLVGGRHDEDRGRVALEKHSAVSVYRNRSRATSPTQLSAATLSIGPRGVVVP